MFHPRRRESGEKVWLKQPSTASPASAWQHADQIAVAAPDSPLPEIIKDVAVKPWREAPKDSAGWESLAETMVLHEPAFDVPAGLKPAAGVVLLEPDGRIWIVAPSNRFGGYSATFPKGRLDGKSLKATAICEAFEESGLQVTLTNFLIDVARPPGRVTTSVGGWVAVRHTWAGNRRR